VIIRQILDTQDRTLRTRFSHNKQDSSFPVDSSLGSETLVRETKSTLGGRNLRYSVNKAKHPYNLTTPILLGSTRLPYLNTIIKL
jgi:hypothetical protein